MGLAVSAFLVVSSFPSYAGQWKQDTAGWKYESDDHTFLQHQWFRDHDGKWYYFESDGYMSANCMTPDGYVTGADGAWIEVLGQSKDQAVPEFFGKRSGCHMVRISEADQSIQH